MVAEVCQAGRGRRAGCRGSEVGIGGSDVGHPEGSRKDTQQRAARATVRRVEDHHGTCVCIEMSRETAT